MTLDLPELEKTNLTPEELRLELACALFARGRVGKISGAALAGVDFFTFQHALKDRGIPQYTEEMLEQDLQTVNELPPRVIVVADTSVILNLAHVGHVQLLQQLYTDVLIPPLVAQEFRHQAQVNPRFAGLMLPPWLRLQTPAGIPSSLRAHPFLDPGETQAIALAIEIQADAVLVDEANGRTAAISLGLRTFGALGVLLQAKRAALLPQVAPVVDALRQQAGFWCSEQLRDRILREAGELS